jgi:hypothetical protein
MTAHRPATGPLTDRDRRRACLLTHIFGASVAAVATMLAAGLAAFQSNPFPVPAWLAAAALAGLLVGVAADLVVRPPRVEADGAWLAVTRLGRRHRVRLDRLVSLSGNPRAAGVLVLADAAGNRAQVDVRCLLRNPLIWHHIETAVNGSRRRGRLMLPRPQSRYWDQVCRQVSEAHRRALTALEFDVTTNEPGSAAPQPRRGHARRGHAGRLPAERGWEASGHPASGLGLAGRMAGSALFVGWLTRPPTPERLSGPIPASTHALPRIEWLRAPGNRALTLLSRAPAARRRTAIQAIPGKTDEERIVELLATTIPGWGYAARGSLGTASPAVPLPGALT